MVVDMRSLEICRLIYSLLCIMGMTLGSCIPDQSDYSYSYQPQCSNGHIKEALGGHAGCKPRPMVLALPWPNNTNVHQMTPTHVEVYQCDGGCHQSSTVCKPLKTRTKKVPVILGKCGLGAGRCEKECAHTTIEEHLECGCECAIKRADCESATHRFRPELCECECRDYNAKRSCLDKGRTWSDQTCSCGCPQEHSCSEGNSYDIDNCLCVPDQQNTTETNIGHEKQEEIVLANIVTREIIVIILLIVINICLVVIVTSLCGRLMYLRKVLNSANLANGDDDYCEIYSKVEKKDDALKPSKLVNNTYSELDIYSASSGFGSEGSKHEDVDSDSVKSNIENVYETAESVRLKKQAIHKKEVDKFEGKDGSLTYSRAIQSIDETLKLLKESAEQL